ncbi:SDA1-domain-containing protein [Dipodascopsis uninucleata]
MPKRRRAALIPSNIALLQNLVRRDPGSYKDEFLIQYSHYNSQRAILSADPTANFQDLEGFINQIGFISQVCTSFSSETAEFPKELAELLSLHHTELPVELREKIVQSLVLLRNRGVITSEFLIQTLFPLLTTTNSKKFRKDIYSTLVQLLKHVNKKSKASKLNRNVQTLLFTLLESTDGDAAQSHGLWAAKLTRELWRRGIWEDARSVEIMKHAALHANPKVTLAGVTFFLSIDKEKEKTLNKKNGLQSESDTDTASSDDESSKAPQISNLKHRAGINKKSGKRARKLEQAIKIVKKKEQGASLPTQLNFSALHLLHDPQGFAELLFSKNLARSSTAKFTLEQRIEILNLVSRLIGVHKLTVLGIYSYLLKFLTPKQRNVTQFMACAAQASHDLVPPDVIFPVIRKVADEFVSDGVAAEVAAAGLNTIREILTRNPLAIEQDLLQDLTEYKGSKSKSVMMAARSLIGLYREVAPEMLARKDRGKIASMEMSAAVADGTMTRLQFGIENSVRGIPGLELLEKWRSDQGLDDDSNVENADVEASKDNDDEWNLELSDSDNEGDWINVESDKEYDLSDDDDDDTDDEKLDTDNEDNADSDKEVNTEDRDSKRVKSLAGSDPIQTLMAKKILSPADFQKLDELKTRAGIDKILRGSRALYTGRNEEAVDAMSLLGSKTGKADKEERLHAVMEGRKDREFGSKMGKKKNESPHSTTNKEKARKKNFIMMIHKRDVQGKNKMSLRDKQKVLRAHIEKQKKKGH